MNVLKQAAVRIVAPLFALAIIAILVAPAAFAQMKLQLQSSNPGDGAILNSEPDKVSVTFSDDTDATKTTMQVFYAKDRNATQTPADNGDGKVDSANPDTINATLKDGLGDGVYFVKYHGVDKASGATVDDQFDFTVDHTATASAGNTGTAAAAGGCDPDKPCANTDYTSTYIMLGVLGVVIILAIASSFILVQRSRTASA